jgi:hypothetical protein
VKKIHLHTAALDNAGLHHDAGSDLTVGEAEKEGVIHPDRAKAMIASHGAKDISSPTAERKAHEVPEPVPPLTPTAPGIPAVE